MANDNYGSAGKNSECAVFRKTLSMLFQKSSFIAQNYPSYLCRKVFWDNGNLVEICRKKDLPHKHSGPGAQALIVVFGDGELEWWVAGELIEKTSIRQCTDNTQSSGIREQWLKRYLNLLGDQYGICPGIGMFDGEDISRCCNTTEKLFPFRRTVAVNCASWINKDVERCVPCSKEYETVKHFLQQQGKLDSQVMGDNEEQIEHKMAPVLEVLADFPHLTCQQITIESQEALEIKVIVGDINVGPPAKQFSLQLSRIVILKSGHLKFCVLSDVIQEGSIYCNGAFDIAALRVHLANLGRNLSACPGYIEYLYGVIHVSFVRPCVGDESASLEPKQYTIIACKRSKQWMNVTSIICSLFSTKYPVCQTPSMLCQCQGCNVVLQQMKDKWPDVFQLFISASDTGLEDIVQQTIPGENGESARNTSPTDNSTNHTPICISPDSEHVPSAPRLSEHQSRMFREVGCIRPAVPIAIDTNQSKDATDAAGIMTSPSVLKEIKVEEVMDSLSPNNLPFHNSHVPEGRINSDVTAANCADFPADLNDLLGIYLDLIDQYPDLIYRFEVHSQAGIRFNPYARANQVLVVKRRHGDVFDFHIKFHPTLKKPMHLASINIFLDGTLEFMVTGHRKALTRVVHGGPARDVINGYLSMLRATYTFCGGISTAQWMSVLPNVRPASVPNIVSLDYPFATFLDENCARWYEYKEVGSNDEGVAELLRGRNGGASEVVNRCQLCQALLDRLQYTQSIIYNTTLQITMQNRTHSRFEPTPLHALISEHPYPPPRPPVVHPPPPRPPHHRPSQPPPPPPALRSPPPLQRHQAAASQNQSPSTSAKPQPPPKHDGYPCSKTLEKLSSLVKDVNSGGARQNVHQQQTRSQKSAAATCTVTSPTDTKDTKRKSPETEKKIEDEEELHATKRKNRYVSVKEFYKHIATKRPLPDDPLEYRGILLKRPRLSVRRLPFEDLPPYEQRRLEDRREARCLRDIADRRARKSLSEQDVLLQESLQSREDDEADMKSADDGGIKRRPRKRAAANVKCMTCEACLRTTICGRCDFCRNPEWKQKCRLRQCPFKSPHSIEKRGWQVLDSQRRLLECGECLGCQRITNCGECDFCKGKKAKFFKCDKKVCWDIIADEEIKALGDKPIQLDEEYDPDYSP